MPADLITRARSAETVEEECDVIDDYAADQAVKGLAPENLLSLVEDVRYGLYPRAVLLGVVAALKPAHLSLAVCSFSADHGCAIAKAGPTDGEARGIEWQRHQRDYMAALIALLEAAGQTGGEG